MEMTGPEVADSSMKEDLAMEIEAPPLCREEGAATAEDWRRALARVVPAVVVLRTTAVRAFDTEPAGASYATGFVVDKARGIVLTNRHVVKPGNDRDVAGIGSGALVGFRLFRVLDRALFGWFLCRAGDRGGDVRK